MRQAGPFPWLIGTAAWLNRPDQADERVTHRSKGSFAFGGQRVGRGQCDGSALKRHSVHDCFSISSRSSADKDLDEYVGRAVWGDEFGIASD